MRSVAGVVRGAFVEVESAGSVMVSATSTLVKYLLLVLPANTNVGVLNFLLLVAKTVLFVTLHANCGSRTANAGCYGARECFSRGVHPSLIRGVTSGPGRVGLTRRGGKGTMELSVCRDDTSKGTCLRMCRCVPCGCRPYSGRFRRPLSRVDDVGWIA